MEKVTINQQFANIKAFLEEHDAPIGYVTFIEDRMAQVAKKNATRSNKPTKAQVENANLAEKVVETLVSGKPYTVSEIQKEVAELSDLSNQRATAIVRSLVRAGSLTRNEVKGKAYFTLA